MVLSGAGFAALLALSSITAATLALLAAARFNPQDARTRHAARLRSVRDGVVFLFDGEALIDATRAGERLIAAAPSGATDWTRLLSLLTPEFPDLADRLEDLAAEGVQVFTSGDDATRLTAEWRSGLRRLTLVDEDVSAPAADIDAHNLAAMERELEVLRTNTDFAPILVWRQDRGGEITWFNRRYLEELRRLRGAEAADRWPVEGMFDAAAVRDCAAKSAPLRASLDFGDDESWFDIHAYDAGEELVCSAIGVNRQVVAERQLRTFTQTLTRTFADLDAGLAIFDRARRLVIFNPALSDLTGLPVGFLTARPTLFGVLDRMRDLGRVPEPRNYSEWRRRMTELESDAAEGHFSETWMLSGGETLRVSGRPHPDRAIAFIFEDISAEITATRRFRMELDAGQAVLDTLEEAVAVFSPSGILTMSNAAYAALWGVDPMVRVDQVTLRDVLSVWTERTTPSPVWKEAAAFLGSSTGRKPWSADMMLLDGRRLTSSFIPLQGGSTMASFRTSVAGADEIPFRRRA